MLAHEPYYGWSGRDYGLRAALSNTCRCWTKWWLPFRRELDPSAGVGDLALLGQRSQFSRKRHLQFQRTVPGDKFKTRLPLVPTPTSVDSEAIAKDDAKDDERAAPDRVS
jgi:hypothetical protein